MYKVFKRIFDFSSSILLLVIISPFLAVVSLAIYFKMGSPIFFKQKRAGKNGKVFYMFKFRSMNENKNEKGELLPDEKRATPFGAWLRSSSVDELPQLFNIIRGDMSVIGPRPLPPSYNIFIKPSEEARFLVRGGLIQPEVLHGEILPSWDNQLKWEAEYGEKLSFLLDLQILNSTIQTLIKRTKTDYGVIVRKPLDEERCGMEKDR